jgi:hypothetical protein
MLFLLVLSCFALNANDHFFMQQEAKLVDDYESMIHIKYPLLVSERALSSRNQMYEKYLNGQLACALREKDKYESDLSRINEYCHKRGFKQLYITQDQKYALLYSDYLSERVQLSIVRLKHSVNPEVCEELYSMSFVSDSKISPFNSGCSNIIAWRLKNYIDRSRINEYRFGMYDVSEKKYNEVCTDCFLQQFHDKHYFIGLNLASIDDRIIALSFIDKEYCYRKNTIEFKQSHKILNFENMTYSDIIAYEPAQMEKQSYPYILFQDGLVHYMLYNTDVQEFVDSLDNTNGTLGINILNNAKDKCLMSKGWDCSIQLFSVINNALNSGKYILSNAVQACFSSDDKSIYLLSNHTLFEYYLPANKVREIYKCDVIADYYPLLPLKVGGVLVKSFKGIIHIHSPAECKYLGYLKKKQNEKREISNQN